MKTWQLKKDNDILMTINVHLLQQKLLQQWRKILPAFSAPSAHSWTWQGNKKSILTERVLNFYSVSIISCQTHIITVIKLRSYNTSVIVVVFHLFISALPYTAVHLYNVSAGGCNLAQFVANKMWAVWGGGAEFARRKFIRFVPLQMLAKGRMKA